MAFALAMSLIIALQSMFHLLGVTAIPAYVAATLAGCALYLRLRRATHEEPFSS